MYGTVSLATLPPNAEGRESKKKEKNGLILVYFC